MHSNAPPVKITMPTELLMGLDYETYSDVELGGTDGKGFPNYSASPNFRVLLAGVHHEDKEFTYDFVFNCIWEEQQKVVVDDEMNNVMDMFQYDLTHGDLREGTIMAHNAAFERGVTEILLPGFDRYRFQD